MVAREYARPLREVDHDPYVLTLYAYVLWLDHDRIEHALIEHARLDLAGLIHHAFHNPVELTNRERAYRTRLGLVQRDNYLQRSRAARRIAKIARARVVALSAPASPPAPPAAPND